MANAKLFKIKFVGYQIPDVYVVAEDATSAYKKVRDDLDKRDVWFDKYREMESIELLAEAEALTPHCGHSLYL